MNPGRHRIVLAALAAGWLAAPAPDAAESARRAPDVIELEETAIRGQQALPRVLYILPWQDAEAPVPADRPFDSLIDDVLGPVDPEVLAREHAWHEQLRPGGGAPGPNQETENP